MIASPMDVWVYLPKVFGCIRRFYMALAPLSPHVIASVSSGVVSSVEVRNFPVVVPA